MKSSWLLDLLFDLSDSGSRLVFGPDAATLQPTGWHSISDICVVNHLVEYSIIRANFLLMKPALLSR